MSSKTNTADQKEIPEVIKDESRPTHKKYERGRFLGKVISFFVLQPGKRLEIKTYLINRVVMIWHLSLSFFLGRIRKMLRTQRYGNSGLTSGCWKNCSQITLGQTTSERENGSRDIPSQNFESSLYSKIVFLL